MRLRVVCTALIYVSLTAISYSQIKESTVQKSAVSGKRSMFRDYYSMEANCAPTEWIDVKVTSGPEHGKATFIERNTNAIYAESSARKSCNGKPVTAKTLTYTPENEYKGPDKIVIDIVDSNGGEFQEMFDISVR